MSARVRDVDQLLGLTAHRPWPLPSGKWQYYQEWNHALFLHWRVERATLLPLVPPGLPLDSLDGSYYVSLVAFAMQRVRPRGLPALSLVSDFSELNVRTYIDRDGKKGVYFLNIAAERALSAFVARALSGLPYEKAELSRSEGHFHGSASLAVSPQSGARTTRMRGNSNKQFRLDAVFTLGAPLGAAKSELDRWLTERYCLYLDSEDALIRYDIHHPEWPLREVQLNELAVDYANGALRLSNATLAAAHYSNGVAVVSWPKQRLA